MEDVISIHGHTYLTGKPLKCGLLSERAPLHTRSNAAHARTACFVQFDSRPKLNSINILQQGELQRRGADLRVSRTRECSSLNSSNKCRVSQGGSAILQIQKSIAATFVPTSATLPLNNFQAAAPNGPPPPNTHIAHLEIQHP